MEVKLASSLKAARISRSSLNSKPQGAATGVDALELVMTTWSLARWPDLDPRDNSTMQAAGPSAIVVDAKSLHDALRREHMGAAADKRTGIELMVIKERLTALGAVTRWQSSERQFADGLTKFAARQLLADRLRCGAMLLVWDADFTAAKKKTADERRRNEQATATSRPAPSRSTSTPTPT